MQTSEPIAVVAMAGVFPGACDLETFWHNIRNKVSAIDAIPPERWIVPTDAMLADQPLPDKAFNARAGLIRGFYPDFKELDLDPVLIETLDPLYHLVLHAGRAAFSDCVSAGVDRRRIGTILAAIALPTDSVSSLSRAVVGHAFETHLPPELRQPDAAPTAAQCQAARVTSLPATLLAKGLRLGGTAYTLDAACASSLVALKLACDHLQAGHADLMLAGGVSRPDSLYTQVGFSQLRALSPSGRCAPFDARADGLVVGEGVGILVLKRLGDAVQANDRIHGVIRGLGLSSDMGGSLLAPDSEGQVRAMRAAYAAAGWSPPDVDLIECHGAGTPVGDRTELQSLCRLWQDAAGRNATPCVIGSVKSTIGHLLTAAGAAGTIKTLLAMANHTLPPTANFESAAADSPLNDSPFQVLRAARHWPVRQPGHGRRAAVSAFGFGGINAHLLLEEWTDPDPVRGRSSLGGTVAETAVGDQTRARPSTVPQAPVAIVGLQTCFGTLNSLRTFQETIFNGRSAIAPRPSLRWRGLDAALKERLGRARLPGAFLETLRIGIDQFRIPPNEIVDIVPQHLLMLQVAADALQDAGLSGRSRRPRTGVVIGMDFDFEASAFHLRWALHNRVQAWKARCRLDDAAAERWLEALREACGPPLTASRTLGNLGGVIASRIAKEFLLGGPAFVVSNDAASGLQALEIAVRSLQRRETDACLVGAVDFGGDVRSVVQRHTLTPYSATDDVRPFDYEATGSLPGEGAAALVLKRLDAAQADGDRIYALVRGLGHAGPVAVAGSRTAEAVYVRSLSHACRDAAVIPGSLQYVEGHGSGVPAEDATELRALCTFFAPKDGPSPLPVAVGALKATIGHSGAAAGMASLAKAVLCLYHAILPPLTSFVRPPDGCRVEDRLHFPIDAHFWYRDREDGPRRAAVAAMTPDGNCSHAVLEAYEPPPQTNRDRQAGPEHRRPLGYAAHGLFVVAGPSVEALAEGLDLLERHLQRSGSAAHPMERAAREWYRQHPPSAGSRRLTILLKRFETAPAALAQARAAVRAGSPSTNGGAAGVYYAPEPLGAAPLAFVYPGSGNHYPGMGRRIGLVWPEILQRQDAVHGRFASQFVPRCFAPQRASWASGWERDVRALILSDPLHTILGQVVHGGTTTALMHALGLHPKALIGYSLGESAGLFACGLWPQRESMRQRMLAGDLFRNQLAGPCYALREAWRIGATEPAEWCVAVVNRPAEQVCAVVAQWPHTRLLIVNTPEECVVGGLAPQVHAVIDTLGCQAVFLDGVVTVHCDAAGPVRDAYHQLHRFPVSNPENVRVYACAWARSYDPTPETVAAAITDQAVGGFDFPAVIERAYADGFRIFLEMGPRASCTRMIRAILAGRPHLAVSVSLQGEADDLSVLKALGALVAEGVDVDLETLYGERQYPPTLDLEDGDAARGPRQPIVTTVGGPPMVPPAPPTLPADGNPQLDPAPPQRTLGPRETAKREEGLCTPTSEDLRRKVVQALAQTAETTAAAHQRFLAFSEELTKTYAATVARQIGLPAPVSDEITPAATDAPKPPEMFSRAMCLEFAIGSVGKVLGPEFAIVDTYPARVRLPDEPLMLVDRIIALEGEKRSLGSGRVITEHDVRPDAWYLDAGRAPVCIAVEAGQADLFLSAWLGIDHVVKGERTYRLLDATVEFFRALPRPGETVRYVIDIQKFVRQGDTHLFFFNFDGYVGDTHLIRMTDGCAGFFTPEEVRRSGGILLTPGTTDPSDDRDPFHWLAPVPSGEPERYGDSAVEALRRGDLEDCFGEAFRGVTLPEHLRLPGGRLRLIDRVLHLDPTGGRYRAGSIRAEADIHPDDWFLTCHFMDDMVMPGTLMYECCAHTLRVFLLRLGWVTAGPDAGYEPVPGVCSVLKCRGPVTPQTRHVVYEIEIKTIGYRPEPFAVADAHMFADGRRIVMFKDMGMRLTDTTQEAIQAFWDAHRAGPRTVHVPAFDRRRLREFATGRPSEAFGEPYRPFDRQRFIARLPAPPYAFIDRVTKIEPPPWVLAPGGWITAEFDVDPDAWYFKANRTATMPYCVLNEVALQACGWLAAYMGSALKSDKDLRFRNLGGQATVFRDVPPEPGRLVTRSRLTRVSEAADMIIEHFEFRVARDGASVYEGDTHFGFFTAEALAQQVGLRPSDQPPERTSEPDAGERLNLVVTAQPIRPLTPDDPAVDTGPPEGIPADALRMFERVITFDPQGGRCGLGLVRAVKRVDPQAWFFAAHFFQDPVCPGSLGLESILQALKLLARERWPQALHRSSFGLLTDVAHEWTYRGQIRPHNKEVVVEAEVTLCEDSPVPTLQADGYVLVDGLYIYRMTNCGIRLVPHEPS